MDFDLSREWLETDGLGGFASGTVVNCNARRYHALLCTATNPPQERVVLVNKLDETLTLRATVGNGRGEETAIARQFDLGCNQYPGAIHPAGHQWLREFHLDPLPRWIYTIPASAFGGQVDLVLEKTLWMPYGQQATVLRYRMLSPHEVTLSAHPYVTGRDFHGTHRANHDFHTHAETSSTAAGCRMQLQPYDGLPPIVFDINGDCHQAGAWYYAFQYAYEEERGLDYEEDAYCPGSLVWHLTPDRDALLVVGTTGHDVLELAATRESEIARRNALESGLKGIAEVDRPFAARLARAADQFIVARRDGLHTILAGYPWFGDWGRDTMIALPGLCLTTGRLEEARSILLSFAGAASEGMIPNRFPDAGEIPDYNTIDATLWFFHAVSRYFEQSGDEETTLKTLFPVLRDSIQWHWRGTRFGIRADENDGLLRGGDARTQLTWMDAKIGDTAFTPRSGKPVEIQALWFNALRVAADLATRAGDAEFAAQCDEWSRRAADNFARLFWNAEFGCLYDCVDGDERNGQIRPNQILAVSLPHRMLNREQEKAVVAVVERDLLTPFGLRSLSPDDQMYRGIYIGSSWQRDSSYHQGTVWGWPIGPFLSAYLHVHDHNAEAKAQVRQWLMPLQGHLDTAGLGSISEIFDGDAPHTPRGCPAQAWSVAEVLRVLAELA